MQTAQNDSRSAIQKIVEEFHDILIYSKFLAFQLVAEVLAKHKISTGNTLVQEIFDSIFRSTPLLIATSVMVLNKG